MTTNTRTLLAVGSYTDGDGSTRGSGHAHPPGLTTWWWDGATGIQPAGSADLPSPSFVCWHPRLPILYAVSELDEGVVTALSVAQDGSPSVVGAAPTGGLQPCWVTTDPAGSVLLVANYGSGSLAAIPLDGAGRPAGGPTVVQHAGRGPVVGRQEGPHVHQAIPTGHGTVLASDLGADRIVEYRIGAGRSGTAPPCAGAVGTTEPGAPGIPVLERIGAVDLPEGCGPRHVALPTGAETGYVTGELDATVTVIRRSRDAGRPGPSAGAGTWTVAERVPCSRHPGALPSHLALSDDGRWLLVANRGPDTIAVFDTTAGLTLRQEIPVGRTPRHFAVAGRRVLVACQGQDTVEVLTLDAATGTLNTLGPLRTVAPAPTLFHAPSSVAVRH